MTSPIAEIRAFIAENRTSDALARLLDMSQGNKQIHDSILMVLAEYNDLNAQRLRGTVSSEEAVLRHNKVNEKVLMALDAFDSQGKVLPGSVGSRKKQSLRLLLIIGVCTTGLGFLLQAISLRIMFQKEMANVFLLIAPMSEWLIPSGLAALGVWLIALFINAIRG